MLKITELLGLELKLHRVPSATINLRDHDQLKIWMAHYGAPFLLSPDSLLLPANYSTLPSPAEVFRAAMKAGRFNPEINTILPLFLHKNLSSVEIDQVIKDSVDKRYLGYILDLLFRLTCDRVYLRLLGEIQLDKLTFKPTKLIKDPRKNQFQEAVFTLVDNPVARTWGFKTTDSFSSIEERFKKWNDVTTRSRNS